MDCVAYKYNWRKDLVCIESKLSEIGSQTDAMLLNGIHSTGSCINISHCTEKDKATSIELYIDYIERESLVLQPQRVVPSFTRYTSYSTHMGKNARTSSLSLSCTASERGFLSPGPPSIAVDQYRPNNEQMMLSLVSRINPAFIAVRNSFLRQCCAILKASLGLLSCPIVSLSSLWTRLTNG